SFFVPEGQCPAGMKNIRGREVPPVDSTEINKTFPWDEGGFFSENVASHKERVGFLPDEFEYLFLRFLQH
ncbi:unnamed protein product, partial [marine sediment metagenome]